jgi:hypothetical protein
MSGNFRLDKPVMQDADAPTEGLSEHFGHVWVEVEDIVIDITGDQFNHGLNTPWPPVYIGSPSDRYLDGAEKDSTEYLQSPLCQAVMQALPLFYGRIPEDENPTTGLRAEDFAWWDRRNPQDQRAFRTRLENLGRRIGDALRSTGSDLVYRATGEIQKNDWYGWVTWAPLSFGDDKAYRKRPHITLDSNRHELLLHLNLELADNADHFASMVKHDPAGVLGTARRLGCELTLHICQRRHLHGMLWQLEHPVFYCLDELTVESLLAAVRTAEDWGRKLGTRQAYFFTQRIPAARAIALGAGLVPHLVRRIEGLRPALDDFDWNC